MRSLLMNHVQDFSAAGRRLELDGGRRVPVLLWVVSILAGSMVSAVFWLAVFGQGFVN